MTAKRYMLTARAQMNGALCEPGHVFTLEDGAKGPMRAVLRSDHGANHAGEPGELRDEPLYVEVKDEADLVAEAKDEDVEHADEPKPGED